MKENVCDPYGWREDQLIYIYIKLRLNLVRPSSIFIQLELGFTLIKVILV